MKPHLCSVKSRSSSMSYAYLVNYFFLLLFSRWIPLCYHSTHALVFCVFLVFFLAHALFGFGPLYYCTVIASSRLFSQLAPNLAQLGKALEGVEKGEGENVFFFSVCFYVVSLTVTACIPSCRYFLKSAVHWFPLGNSIPGVEHCSLFVCVPGVVTFPLWLKWRLLCHSKCF